MTHTPDPTCPICNGHGVEDLAGFAMIPCQRCSQEAVNEPQPEDQKIDMTAYILAKRRFDDGEITPAALLQSWLDEVNSCYEKHGGQFTLLSHSVAPFHWSICITKYTKEDDFFGLPLGAITISPKLVSPENAAKGIIAYEKAVIGVPS